VIEKKGELIMDEMMTTQEKNFGRFSVGTFSQKGLGRVGDISLVKTGFKSTKEARKWIKDFGEVGENYLVIKVTSQVISVNECKKRILTASDIMEFKSEIVEGEVE